MHYSINVSKSGRFYCEINRLSDSNEANIEDFVTELKTLYPVSEGFKLDITSVATYRTKVTLKQDQL